MNYHKKELNKVDPLSSDYAPTFKVKNENSESKWIDLKSESAKELIIWLAENYYKAYKQAKNHIESDNFNSYA
jgi:flagellin-specific chaperone FliS